MIFEEEPGGGKEVVQGCVGNTSLAEGTARAGTSLAAHQEKKAPREQGNR